MNPNRKVLGTSTQKLKVILTQDEKARGHERLLGLHNEIEAHTREEKELAANMKRKRALLEGQRGNLAAMLTAGHDWRDVEVEKIADYESGQILHIRVDTGEEVERERMPESVRQTELPLATSEPPAASPDDVDSDSDPWGAPSDGVPPTLALPEEVIEGEIVEDGEAESTAPPAPPADPVTAKIEWLRTLTPDQIAEHLESCEVDEVRTLYARVIGDDPGRAQKRTMIPKLIAFLRPF